MDSPNVPSPNLRHPTPEPHGEPASRRRRWLVIATAVVPGSPCPAEPSPIPMMSVLALAVRRWPTTGWRLVPPRPCSGSRRGIIADSTANRLPS